MNVDRMAANLQEQHGNGAVLIASTFYVEAVKVEDLRAISQWTRVLEQLGVPTL